MDKDHVIENKEKFNDFRNKYPDFIYESFSWQINGNLLSLYFFYSFGDFKNIKTSIELELPENTSLEKIKTSEDYIFRIGLLNSLSYWKAHCSPNILVLCGKLEEKEISWWQDLWYEGMGEFRYRNGLLDVLKDSWVRFSFSQNILKIEHDFSKLFGNLIAFTGGKDSSLALGILKEEKENSETFSINPPKNIGVIRKFFGYENNFETIINRKIDDSLIFLNKNGALNGHTPFSAVVAMLGVYVAYLRNKKYVIVSNESSADEETVKGTEINHQYSKSLIFEKKFREYCDLVWPDGPEYFSLLRPISEISILKMFKNYENILPEISSCNVKIKDGVWCGKCGKCLFAYLILSAVWNIDFARKITNKDMFSNIDNLNILKELTGISSTKPFECVGTKEESLSAISVIINRDESYKRELILEMFLNEYKNILPDVDDFEKIADTLHESVMPEKFLEILLKNKNG